MNGTHITTITVRRQDGAMETDGTSVGRALRAPTRARDVLDYIDAIVLTAYRLREPIEVGPFLAWCDRRLAAIRRDLDTLPAIERTASLGEEQRLLADLGWTGEAGARRMHRWRNENRAGLAERAEVEDALWNADMALDEVYPDFADAGRKPHPIVGRAVRRMTDEQVLAAHIVYGRCKLSSTELGGLLYHKYGYANAESAGRALQRAFKNLGLPPRACVATARGGAPCAKWPVSGSDYCVEHAGGRQGIAACQPTDEQRHPYRPDDILMGQARRMHHEEGISMLRIAEALAPRTPIGQRRLRDILAGEFERRGWQRDGRGRNRYTSRAA